MINSVNLSALLSTAMGLHIQKLIIASIFFIVGIIIAKLLQIVLVYALDKLNLDGLLEKIGFNEITKKVEISSSATKLLGGLIFWIVLFLSLIWIVYAFNLTRALELIRIILSYVTINVLSAAFVLILAVVLGNLLSMIILFLGSIIALPGYKLIARINQYVVVIFGLVLGLDRLGISMKLLLSKPDIILGFFALAGAIAFGLGCKDLAENFLANFLRNNK